MDGIELEIVWSNLISIVSEQAKRSASRSVRDRHRAGRQYAVRPPGRMVAQAVTGTPGHINSLAAAGKPSSRPFRPRRSCPATC